MSISPTAPTSLRSGSVAGRRPTKAGADLPLFLAKDGASPPARGDEFQPSGASQAEQLQDKTLAASKPTSMLRRVGLYGGAMLAGLTVLGIAGAVAPIQHATVVSETRTDLQKHVDFFDRDNDGDIQVNETYDGLRALGMGRGKSAVVSTVIGGALGRKTGAPWYSPTTVITSGIHHGKHGSDTDIYDAKGHADFKAVEKEFTAHDADKNQVLDASELEALMLSNREESGEAAARAEFEMLLELAGEPTQVNGETVSTLSKERFHQLYDGSLFYRLAGEEVPAN